MSELEAILERVRSSLSPEEYAKLHAAMETLVFLTQELEKKRVLCRWAATQTNQTSPQYFGGYCQRTMKEKAAYRQNLPT